MWVLMCVLLSFHSHILIRQKQHREICTFSDTVIINARTVFCSFTFGLVLHDIYWHRVANVKKPFRLVNCSVSSSLVLLQCAHQRGRLYCNDDATQ